jgi:acetamidase/formamidase
MTVHRLEPAPHTTAAAFSRDHEPVLRIAPGDRVVVDTLDAAGYLNRQTVPGERQPTMHPDRRGHCLAGPIAVTGARPGDMLALRLVDLRPGSWGWTGAGGRSTRVTERLGVTDAGASLLWDLDADAGIGTESRGFVRRLAPFLGVLGVAPAEPGGHSTIPPRPGSGGNIDCRELVAGATLHLPVAVPDALLYLGDGHAAQGDGEVGGTAIECPMTTELVVDLATEPALPTVHARTPAGRITFGFDADLNVATGDALDAMVTWLQSLHDVDRPTALALAGVCVDLRITQVANETWGVHAVLADDALTG